MPFHVYDNTEVLQDMGANDRLAIWRPNHHIARNRFSFENPLVHEGHEGTRRKTFVTLRVPSGQALGARPSWIIFIRRGGQLRP